MKMLNTDKKPFRNMPFWHRGGMTCMGVLLVIFTLTSCHNHEDDGHNHEGHDHEEATAETPKETDRVHLLEEQMEVMNIRTGGFQEINLSTTVKSNGQLELPPQNMASVSPLMAGRIKSVTVIEGNSVKKGQVLARLEHPEFLQMQEDYLHAFTDLEFLTKDYERKKTLLADSITSRKKYEEAEAKFRSAKAKVATLAAKLELIGINVKALEGGTVAKSVPVVAPISGFVHLLEINIGKFVQPEEVLFEIVDNDHIHMDLKVYEKDIDRIKEGQKVTFSLTSQPDELFEGKVFAIGKHFENDPKAVIIHAEIDNKTGNLLPGMYVDARIETEAAPVRSLPDEAIIEDEGLSYIFVREEVEAHVHGEKDPADGHEHGVGEPDDHAGEFIFRKIEVNTGARDIGFTEVVPAQKIPKEAEVVVQGAFYLLAELKKGDGGHGHHH